MHEKPLVHIATPFVQDIGAFRRAAFWLSRTRLPPGSVSWTVCADGSVVNLASLEEILRSFTSSYRWDLVELGRVFGNDAEVSWRIATDFRPPGLSLACYMASDTIIPPETLPALLAAVVANPSNVITCRAFKIAPDTLLTYDLYGSGFRPPARYDPVVSFRPEASALCGWDPRTACDGDQEIEAEAPVFAQLDRSTLPSAAGRYEVLSVTSSLSSEVAA